MIITVTAYRALDGWHVLCTEHEATDSGRRWTTLLNELLRDVNDSDGPWEAIWRIGQELCEQALRFEARERERSK
jgi:hypothetical protein